MKKKHNSKHLKLVFYHFNYNNYRFSHIVLFWSFLIYFLRIFVELIIM